MIIDYDRDKLLSQFGIETYKSRYMIPGEKSPQDAMARAAKAFATDDAHAQRLYDYASKLWFCFSTPILSNGGTERGLPISCFLNYVPDSRKGITDHYTENAFLSSVGGGIGSYWGDLRSAGTKTSKGSESTGPIPFIKVVDAEMLAFAQGVTRRGSCAVWMDINNPEIEEFLDLRKPTGDFNRRSTNLHHGVVLSDAFMRIIKKASEIPGYDDSWDLIDPHTKKVTKTVSAKALWVKIIENRVQLGEPYIMFGDTVNRAFPHWLKAQGLSVRHSNLCTEILLGANEERTAVCVISSPNAEEFDSWKNCETFIPDIMEMFDNIITYFYSNAPKELKKAAYSAYRERSVGLGLMGFHAYLQRHHVPFDSPFARHINKTIFEHMRKECARADAILCEKRGPCPDAKEAGVNRRFSHWMAPAPNASSSILCGDTSPGIEPFPANAYTRKTLNGSALLKNEYLEHILQEIGQDTPEVWDSIVANGGSVQHLPFLDHHTKAVFATAKEIRQSTVILMAGERAGLICQGQSVNLYYPPKVSKLELHNDVMLAWESGVKTLYYLRSEAEARAENISNQIQRAYIPVNKDECEACAD